MAFLNVNTSLPTRVENRPSATSGIMESHIRGVLGANFSDEWNRASGHVMDVGHYGPQITNRDLNRLLGSVERAQPGAKNVKRVGEQAQRMISSAVGDVRFAIDAAKKGQDKALTALDEHVGELTDKLHELAGGKAAGFAEEKLSHTHTMGAAADAPKTMEAVLGATHTGTTHTIKVGGKKFTFHDKSVLESTGPAAEQALAENQAKLADVKEALQGWKSNAEGLIREGTETHLDKLAAAEEHLLGHASEVATKTGVAAKAPGGRWGKKAPASTAAAVTQAEAAAEKAATGVKGKFTFGTVAAAGLGAAAALIGGKGLLTDIGMLEARRGPDGEPEKGNFLMDAAVTAAGIAGLIYAHRSYHGAGVGHTAA